MPAKWKCKACGHMGLMIYQTIMSYYIGTNEAHPRTVDGHPRHLFETEISPGQIAMRLKPIACPNCKTHGREHFEEILHERPADDPEMTPKIAKLIGGFRDEIDKPVVEIRIMRERLEGLCRDMEEWLGKQ